MLEDGFGGKSEFLHSNIFSNRLSSLKCPVTAHWGCLAKTQRDEILKAVRSKERIAWIMKNPEGDVDKDGPKKRPGLEIDETTEFICGTQISYIAGI